MDIFTTILATVLWLYLLVLLGRVVFDWIQVLARDWRPKGVVLVIAEAIYTLTDPPLRALRRLIPPLRIGQFRLDIAFLVLFIAVSFGANVLAVL